MMNKNITMGNALELAMVNSFNSKQVYIVLFFTLWLIERAIHKSGMCPGVKNLGDFLPLFASRFLLVSPLNKFIRKNKSEAGCERTLLLM